MNIIAINGSPHAKGNTYHALAIMQDIFTKSAIEMEIIHVGHKAIHGCIGCNKCAESRNEECPSFPNDLVNTSIQRIKKADALILASPVYYSGVAGTMKCFLDRSFYVAGVNGNLFRNKIGASITVQRRTGGSTTLDCLNHYFSISEMPIASSTYWNAIHGLTPGEILQDEEGIQTLQNLAQNIAWLMQIRKNAETLLPPPNSTKKARTNFIRS